MYKPFAPHHFIERLHAHPAFASADRAHIDEAVAHPAYCLASRVCVQHWEAAQLQARAQQWNVYGSGIGLRQRRTLLCRGSVCELLVRRLMCFQGELQCGVRNALHHACCIISRRHFLVSKNAAETLFQEGQRLYGEQRYSEAAKSWCQAALLLHAPSHAFASSLLYDGRADVAKDEQRAFEFAAAGAALGCAHSKGALGRCLFTAQVVLKTSTEGWRLRWRALTRAAASGSLCLERAMIQDVVLHKTMPRLCDGTALQRHRGMQPLSATWAVCLLMVMVSLKTMPRLCDGTDVQQHRGMQSLSIAWASCFRMVEVLHKTMPRPCDGTDLQRHRGMQALSTTWASCFVTVKVSLKTMPSLCDGSNLQQHRGMHSLSCTWE